MDLEYTPKATKGADAKVTGSVTVKVPSIIEKYDYFDKCGVKVDGAGNVDIKELNSIKVISTLVRLSEKHYKAINLKKKAGGVVDSWDKLIHDPDCEGVVTEVASALLGGFRPSGN